MRANLEAFERRRLRPRMLAGNVERDLSVEVLGLRSPVPFLLAPIGVLSIAHSDAELGVARAARATGVPMILSSAASSSLEDVAAELGDSPRWYQLYWFDDRELVGSIVDRAGAAGYGAIVVTLDTLMLGWRPRDLGNGYLPFLQGEGLAQFFSDPVFRSWLDEPPEDDVLTASVRALSVFSNLGLTWADLAWLRERTELPILVKGVLTAEDARIALEHGVDGIVVSNHGGRQVDGAVAAARCARRGARRGGRRRDGADGQRNPHRLGRAEGSRARRRRRPARPSLRLRARGRRSRGRRGGDPAACGGDRHRARAHGRSLDPRSRPERGHVKLYREEHGDGPPLLLIAGLGYAIWSWQRQIPVWSESFRVIAVENRGAGRSPKPPGPYSIEALADDAAEALEGRRAHVAGFSMGGYIAQTLALRHPELVERLVLDLHGHRRPEPSAHAGRDDRDLGGACRPTAARVRARLDAALLRARLDGRAPGRVRAAPRRPARVPDSAGVLARPVRRLLALRRAGLAGRADRQRRRSSIHGDADRIVPYENGVELARRIPGARFERFAGGGHLLFLESPERFNRTVAEFLA